MICENLNEEKSPAVRTGNIKLLYHAVISEKVPMQVHGSLEHSMLKMDTKVL